MVDLGRLRQGTCGVQRGAQLGDSLGIDIPGDAGVPDKAQGPCQGLVRYGIGSGDLVGHMHLVTVLNKAAQGAPHPDHVVIGVRREHEDALREDAG